MPGAEKSWRDDARILHREVLPLWGHRKAFDITRRDVLTLPDRMVQRGAPVQANRVLALIRKLYNWAISRDLIEHNPCIQVKPLGKEHQRDRVLTDDEIRLIWHATDQLDPLTAVQFKLRLLTAQRDRKSCSYHTTSDGRLPATWPAWEFHVWWLGKS
jgi:site-specific recombinase XerD